MTFDKERQHVIAGPSLYGCMCKSCSHWCHVQHYDCCSCCYNNMVYVKETLLSITDILVGRKFFDDMVVTFLPS